MGNGGHIHAREAHTRAHEQIRTLAVYTLTHTPTAALVHGRSADRAEAVSVASEGGGEWNRSGAEGERWDWPERRTHRKPKPMRTKSATSLRVKWS